jgi:hypothetical protein
MELNSKKPTMVSNNTLRRRQPRVAMVMGITASTEPKA